MATTPEIKAAFFQSLLEENRGFKRPIPKTKNKWVPHINWPLVPGLWETLGSEAEVDPEVFSFPASARTMKWNITKLRKDVGQPLNLSLCNPEDVKDGYLNCVLKTAKDGSLEEEDEEEEGEAVVKPPGGEANLVTKLRELEAEEQPIFDMEKLLAWPKLIDRVVECSHKSLDVACQAGEGLKHNRPTQTEPQLMTDEKAHLYMMHPRLKTIMGRFWPHLDRSLQQGALADPYRDDWKELDDELATDLMEISGSSKRLKVDRGYRH
jgi:hypothetical protein